MADMFQPLILGIGGTSRPNSTSELSVRCALKAAEAMGARTRLIDGALISGLPLYVPGRSERTEEESLFVEAVRDCDGVIVASAGYHGSITGPVKNALDLLEDLARDERPYLDGCAFGAIVTAFGWLACGTTLVTLRSIAHALRAWPTPYGAAFVPEGRMFEDDGTAVDAKVGGQIALVARQVVDFARWRQAGLSVFQG
ncbi:NADPH-dependent FMN reductase [uncultured Sphingomonas sp.]|uniref:NADPH-dependent FMN reductase n=1 Tax=uncultured Sphingomonas sp. TaxID=158754 RepID=UPI0025FCFD40|nr:NADPH-dependent FMN reductase [uncultured Sphingomonas sp.]